MEKDFDRIEAELNGIAPEVCSQLYEFAKKDMEQLKAIDNPEEQDLVILSYCYYFLLSIKKIQILKNENTRLKTELKKSGHDKASAAPKDTVSGIQVETDRGSVRDEEYQQIASAYQKTKAELENTKIMLASAKEAIDAWQAKQKVQDEQLNDINRAYEGAVRMLHETQKALDEQKKMSEKLQIYAEDMQRENARMKEFQKEREQIQDELARLKVENEQLAAYLRSLEKKQEQTGAKSGSEHKNAGNETDQLRQELSITQAMLTKCQHESIAYWNKCIEVQKEAEKACRELEAGRLETEKEKEKLQKQVSYLLNQLSSQPSADSDLEEAYENIRIETEQMRHELNARTLENEKLSEMLRGVQAEREDLAAQLAAVQQQSEAYQKDLSEMKHQMRSQNAPRQDDLQAQYDACLDENEKLRQQFSEKSKEVRTLTKQLLALRLKLGTASEDDNKES